MRWCGGPVEHDLAVDISNRSLLFTSRVHKDDRQFLLYHWDAQISSIRDFKTKAVVEKKLAREAKYEEYANSQSIPTPSISSTTPTSSPDSSEEFLPKRSTGTIPSDIMKKIGPAADRCSPIQVNCTET